MPATPTTTEVFNDVLKIARRWYAKGGVTPSPAQLQELRGSLYGYLEACILAAESDAVISRARGTGELPTQGRTNFEP
jgi:hypothetical protein